MGKKDKKKFRNKISKATEPHFAGTFQNSDNDINTSNSVPERSVFQTGEISDRDKEFCDYLSQQLFNYLESRIKIVDVPEETLDLHQFEIKEVPMFLGSPLLDEDTIMEKSETTFPLPKKKRKKEKRSKKECFKEVAVTADWLEKQAKLFNS